MVLLHQLFEAQARRTPEAIAVRFGDAELSYRALDERADLLARALSARGVGPDILVGVCAERSLELVVAVYGVLKAGGAYVPLDPSYPRERLTSMLDDLGDGILITQAHLEVRIPPSRTKHLVIDRDWAKLALTHEAATTSPAAASLAYMIYTSGSTGRPNGAMNSHAAIVNRIDWTQAEYPLDASDVVLHKTPFSFDVSVWELFWPLAVGARLVLAKPEGHKDPTYLRDLIERERVTLLHFVPSMLTAFLETPRLEEACGSLRKVLASGEALPRPLVQRFYARVSAELHNLYGPTEAAVDVTYYACHKDDRRSNVPIGRPITNLSMYVLDRDLREVPAGEQGELFIGGVGFGRGYHAKPDLTADRFVPSPFGPPGARTYRTGDLGQWVDGQLEYLGRTDQQVKLRGFRIELGDIEAAVRTFPGVREVAVVMQRDRAENQRLVAFFSGDVDARALGSALRRQLPEHMVPARLVELPTLPLSPSGKIDRKALPRQLGRPKLGHDVVLARTGLERELVTIWEHELDVTPIGVTDNFSELGGYSLAAVRIVGRIARLHGVTLPISSLLEHSTIERLAHVLDGGAAPSFSPLVQLHAGTKRPLFLVHPIGGNVFCYVDVAQLLGEDQAVYGLQQIGLDGRQDPQRTVEEQAATYVGIMRTVQPRGPYLVGGWSFGGTVAYEMADQLRRSGEEVALLLNLDARASTPATRDKVASIVRNFDRAILAFWFAVIMNRIAGIETECSAVDFEGLDDKARVARIYREVQHESGGDDVAGLDQIAISFRLFETNLKALNAYSPPKSSDAMTLVRAVVPVAQLPGRPTPPPWNWEAFCSRLETLDVEATHFMMLHQHNADRLADVVRPVLQRAHDAIAARGA